MIYDSMHALILGGTPIDGFDATFTDGGYRFSVLADGYEPGSAEAVESVVRALAADGSSARIDGHDNAETTFRLKIEGEDHGSLNRGEAAFRRLLPDGYSAPVDLLSRPPQDDAPASVRTIITGKFDQDWDDFDELRIERVYVVTLTHRPFVRSEFPSVAKALSVGEGTQTTINDCTSITDWSAVGTGGVAITPTTSGGAIHFVLPPSAGLRGWTLTIAGTYDLALTPYLAVEVQFPPMSLGDDGLLRAGGEWIEPIQKVISTDGYQRYIFDTSAPGVTWTPGPVTLHFGQAASGTIARTLKVRHVEALPVANPGLPRQNARILKIGGTERTPGTLHVYSRDASPLGTAFVHTSPDEGTGYDPDLSRWIGATLTPDPAAPMGGWLAAAPTRRAEVPSSSLATGTYQIVLYLKSPTTIRLRFQWLALTIPIPGTVEATGAASGSAWVDLIADRPTLVAIGTTTLPVSRAQQGRTAIDFGAEGGSNVLIGGAWLLRTGRECAISAVRTNEPHMWIEGAEAGNAGSILIGSAADQSDSHAPGGNSSEILASEAHTFRAGNVIAYVMSAAPNAAVEVEHYRRWPFNAADDGTGDPT